LPAVAPNTLRTSIWQFKQQQEALLAQRLLVKPRKK
jgi:hypothetical protein